VKRINLWSAVNFDVSLWLFMVPINCTFRSSLLPGRKRSAPPLSSLVEPLAVSQPVTQARILWPSQKAAEELGSSAKAGRTSLLVCHR